MPRLIIFIPVLILIPILSWGLGENIKNNKDAIKEKIQNKVEVVRSNNNNPSVSSANKELIRQFKNDFTTIEDLEETLASAVKEQGKDALFQDIQTNVEVQYGLTANDLPSYINTISINHTELKVKKYTGIGPNDFIDLFNCEFLSKTKIQDIS